jgi:hypothetical protein
MSPQETKRKFSAFELIQGRVYQVITDFIDYDGLPHKVGESWRFIGKDFLPYDDGLTLYIERAGKNSALRMQCSSEFQGDIVSSFSDFVEEL